MLAARRLTERQLRERLAKREFAPDEIERTVDACRRGGFVDDLLYARLYVETKRKAVGDRRLLAELVQRGVDRELAASCVASAEASEGERLGAAIERVFRSRPGIAYPSAARSLERLGFPAASIYRALRERSILQMNDG